MAGKWVEVGGQGLSGGGCDAGTEWGARGWGMVVHGVMDGGCEAGTGWGANR